MLANFLEKSKPINFIIFLGVFFCFFFTTVSLNISKEEFSWYAVFASVFYFFIFLSIFFFYHFFVSKNKLTFDNSYSFFLFTLTIIVYISKLLDFKLLMLLLIYLFFLRKIYSLGSSKKVIQKIFDSSLWLGILFILEPFSLLFSILIFAAILLHQKITIHTLITPFIGFATPLVSYFAYLLWNNSIEEFTQLFYFDVINTPSIYAKDYTIWIFGVLFLLTTFSIFLKSPKALSVNNSFKKNWILLILNLIITTVFALTINEENGSEIIFLLAPSSIIIANGFEAIQKKVLKNILIGLLLIGTIVTFFLTTI
mgnify:CR=1 FL=1|tara:strand:+ start:964 stop:1899 length:936 start_codon:yes stop_codon:yes gene_type:complete